MRARRVSRGPLAPNIGWITCALSIFLLAAAVRLVVWNQVKGLPLFATLELDSKEYMDWASRLAVGDFRWPSAPTHGPGYPFFLALLLRLGGGSTSVVRAVQALLGAADCVAVAWLARRFFGTLAGWVSGLSLASWGFLAWSDVSLMSEALLLPLLTAAMVTLVSSGRTPILSLVTGVLIGLAALIRPTALAMLPLLLVFGAFWTQAPERPPGRPWRAGLLVIGALLPLLPVFAANARAGGSVLAIQGNGGLNFFIGNSPEGTGLPTLRPRAGWDRVEAEAVRHGFRQPGEQDRYFFRKTIDQIVRSPAAYLRLLGAKLIWTLQADEIRDPRTFYFFRDASPLLRWLPGLGLFFPLALLGAVFSRSRRPRDLTLVLGWSAAGILVCVLLVTSARYRLPILPPLAVLAGAGTVAMRDAYRAGRRKQVLVAATLVVGLAVAHLRRHEASHNLAEEWAATGFALIHAHDLDRAEISFERALKENPRWSPALAGAGVVALNRGDVPRAEHCLQQSLSIEPEDVASLIEMGAVWERERRWTAAEAQYRRAIAIAPADFESRQALVRVLMEGGRLKEAQDAAGQLLALDPDNAAAHLLRARIYGARHLPRPGASEAAIAVRLDPSDPVAWLTLAMLRIDSGDLQDAETAIARAAALGIDPRQTRLARARLDRARSARSDGALDHGGV